MKSRKLRWSWKHYSFQPDINHAKIKGWPVWAAVGIAIVGIMGISYALIGGQ